MKKLIFSAVASAMLFSGITTSCSTDDALTDGFGKAEFSLEVSDNVKQLTRAVDETQLEESCLLYIYQGDKLVRKYNGISTIGELVLLSGGYRAEAMAGEYMPASFDKQYFEGGATFTVSKNSTEEVSILCKIQNVVASVDVDESVAEVLDDVKVTVSHSEGVLEFANDLLTIGKGYFMMPEGETSLSYTVTGTYKTGNDIGGTFNKSGLIENVVPATEYVLTINYNKEAGNLGGTFFDIVVNENPIEDGNHEIVIHSAPNIAAPNNVELGEVLARKGELQQYIVYVASSSKLTSLSVSCPKFQSSLGMPADEFNFVFNGNDMSDSEIQTVRAAGLSYSDKTEPADAADGKQLKMLEFGNAFFDKVNANVGEYAITVKAIDSYNQTSVATLTLNITEDKVISQKEPAELGYTGVVLSAQLADPEATDPGFEYRQIATRADGDWIRVTDVVINGNMYSLELKNLTPGATYEYRAVSTGFTGPTYQFVTKAYPQLENAGFETWGTKGKIVVPAANYDNFLWDTGNHGSSKAGVTLTNPDSEMKHSGSYSARLRSQKAALFGIGKFAAGNMFLGKYITTEGTDGILGFGRPFNFPVYQNKTITPKAVKLWVRYEPGTVEEMGSITSDITTEIVKGGLDQGQIFIALCDKCEEEYNGEKYPFVIKTKNQSRLFNKDDAQVLAYGEHTFKEATAGSGLVELTIPIEYYAGSESRVPTHIVFVASASKYGDYFGGGEGSTMWLDDIELIYE